MEEGPATLIGVTMIAFGVTLVYGGYKNKRVFGKDGIIPTAISKGTLASTADIPPMFPDFKVSRSNLDLPGAVVDDITDLGDALAIEAQKTGNPVATGWAKIWDRIKTIWTPATATIHTEPQQDVIDAIGKMYVNEPVHATQLAGEIAKLSATGSPAYNTTAIAALLRGFRESWGNPPGQYRAEADIVAAYVKGVTGDSV